jgi:hypothetical protein
MDLISALSGGLIVLFILGLIKIIKIIKNKVSGLTNNDIQFQRLENLINVNRQNLERRLDTQNTLLNERIDFCEKSKKK